MWIWMLAGILLLATLFSAIFAFTKGLDRFEHLAEGYFYMFLVLFLMALSVILFGV